MSRLPHTILQWMGSLSQELQSLHLPMGKNKFGRDEVECMGHKKIGIKFISLQYASRIFEVRSSKPIFMYLMNSMFKLATKSVADWWSLIREVRRSKTSIPDKRSKGFVA